MFEEVALRRSAIAYVFPENPQLKREDSLQFYDRVTASAIEIPEFRMDAGEVVLLRNPSVGKSGLEIRAGSFGTGPNLRLLVAHLVGEDPVAVSREYADLAWDAFEKIWGARISTPQLVEVTLDFAVQAPGGDSKTFLVSKVGSVDTAALKKLGREHEGFGLRIMSGPAITLGEGTGPTLPGAVLELKIETLLEDQSQIFIQAQVKWPAMNIPRDAIPEAARNQLQDQFLQLNIKAEPPTFYLEGVYEFVTTNVVEFLRQAAR